MNYLDFSSEYDKFPVCSMNGWRSHAFRGASEIVKELAKLPSGTIAFELYPGVDLLHFEQTIIGPLHPARAINVELSKKTEEEFKLLLDNQLTTDRVFGRMIPRSIEDFYPSERLNEISRQLHENVERTVVYGFGATLFPHDYLVYVDITRWEIQLRFRKGMPNFTADNRTEDPLRKFKRGYFVEWRVADQIKRKHYESAKYLISADNPNELTMITQEAFQSGMNRLSSSPFRLIPYFDPGVWGGQWMKEVCNLPKETSNYAWSFDGVPEENALALRFDEITFVFPAINLVFFRPQPLLGKRIYDRFGAEFPIRFDFLDTMGGGNLSLQVHPLTEYIQSTFGMAYTQDESYYILDASPESIVYLGVKTGIDPDQFIKALEDANAGKAPFEDHRFINRIPVKKHDHVLIPAGTIHCSGKNTMVLEISATPYIFTFKLWDWGRLGLDGIPRPVHLQHGKNVVCYDRDTEWVNANLVNRFETISSVEERTGLHEKEFIETRRLTLNPMAVTKTEGSVNVLNLVEGKAVQIESTDESFQPFVVHYAETFIVPESVKEYRIVNLHPERLAMVIKAFVR
jgi:mannose-6-phosphate isomerase class I